MSTYIDDETINASAEAEWRASPATRAEFGGNQDAFRAYQQANARGHVKIVTRAPRPHAHEHSNGQHTAAKPGAPTAQSHRPPDHPPAPQGYLTCADGRQQIAYDETWPDWRKAQARAIAARPSPRKGARHV